MSLESTYYTQHSPNYIYLTKGGFTLESKSEPIEVGRPLLHGLTFRLKIGFKLEAWFLLVGVHEYFELGDNKNL